MDFTGKVEAVRREQQLLTRVLALEAIVGFLLAELGRNFGEEERFKAALGRAIGNFTSSGPPSDAIGLSPTEMQAISRAAQARVLRACRALAKASRSSQATVN